MSQEFEYSRSTAAAAATAGATHCCRGHAAATGGQSRSVGGQVAILEKREDLCLRPELRQQGRKVAAFFGCVPCCSSRVLRIACMRHDVHGQCSSATKEEARQIQRIRPLRSSLLPLMSELNCGGG